MNFKEWFTRRGMSMSSFGRLVGLPKSTICNLNKGKPALAQTVKKLVKATNKYPDPITYDMFPKVYFRGTYKTTTGTEAFKIFLEKSLKRKK